MAGDGEYGYGTRSFVSAGKRPESPPPPPPPSSSRATGWKLALPNLSTDRSRPSTAHRDAVSATELGALSPLFPFPAPELPSPALTPANPMSSFANAFSMKKRLSDSLTDTWSRRRPSLPQGNSTGSIPTASSARSKDSSSKSRSRAASATASASNSNPRSPPLLTSSASMATIGSTATSSSAGSSYISRQDSYSDMIVQGFPQPPVGVAVTSKGSSVEDSPTVPVYDTIRSRRIATEEDIHEVEEAAENQEAEAEAEAEARENAGAGGEGGNSAEGLGVRKAGGITRKISNSRRIIRPPSPNDDDERVDSASINSNPFAEEPIPQDGARLGVPSSSGKRDSKLKGLPLDAAVYESSDEESSASSLRSAGKRSNADSESSTRSGLPQTISFSHGKRGSRPPPPLEILDTTQPPLSALEAHAMSPRPHSSGPPLRSMTSSPLKSGISVSSSSRAKSIAVLDVPVASPSSASRVSLANQQGVTSGPTSRSTSGTSATAVSAIGRSDSNSSNTSTTTSTAPNTSRTNPPASAGPSAAAVASSRHKYLTSRDRKNSTKSSLAHQARNRERPGHNLEPPIPDPAAAPKVAPAPASGMYWYKAPTHGLDHKPLRAHTCTLVGSNIYVFGGCNSRTCFNELHVFDADSMSWTKPYVYGDIPPPLRAMTTTAVRNKLVIFGGGDGPTYYNDIYVFDTATSRYSRPQLVGGQQPCRRRAHTACLYKNGIYVFGGGDGVRALNDVWRLDVSDLNKPSWRLISPPSRSTGSSANGSSTAVSEAPKPTARGYHTANMVGSKLIIYGGSDGDDCFKDVWVFDVETITWKCVEIKKSFSRLSHTATIIGSYLFVVGGHDGVEYSSEVLLLNLVTMQWDRRKVYGMPPSGRGYHGAVLYDSRLFVVGGFDGQHVFNDTYILELAVSSYYSQISHFSIVTSPGSS